jgi:hypothetical protein
MNFEKEMVMKNFQEFVYKFFKGKLVVFLGKFFGGSSLYNKQVFFRMFYVYYIDNLYYLDVKKRQGLNRKNRCKTFDCFINRKIA